MNLQVDDVVVIGTVLSGAIATVSIVLRSVWYLIKSLKTDVVLQLAATDKGIEDRQATFMSMMQQHIANEEREFRAQAATTTQLQHDISDMRNEFVTKEYLAIKLTPICTDISTMRKIIDARGRNGLDPVSERPSIERRAVSEGR